jgi:hypothetical protein
MYAPPLRLEDHILLLLGTLSGTGALEPPVFLLGVVGRTSGCEEMRTPGLVGLALPLFLGLLGCGLIALPLPHPFLETRLAHAHPGPALVLGLRLVPLVVFGLAFRHRHTPLRSSYPRRDSSLATDRPGP